MDGSNNLPLSPQVKNSVTVVPAASGVPVDKSPDASTETKDGETKQQGSSVAKKTASAIIPSDAGAVAGIPEIASARADTSLGIPEISIPRVTLQEIMPLPGALVDFLPAVLPVSIQQLPPPLLPTAVSIRIHF
jgi:hypothetical protein